MAFMYTEGTKDFIAATPVLLTTFQASGSITAGTFVIFVGATDQRVYMPASTYQGSGIPAGLAIQTCSDGDPVPVVVWGYCKNVATSGTAVTYITQMISVSGSGWAYNSGSGLIKSMGYVGKAVSGSATQCTAFINCLP